MLHFGKFFFQKKGSLPKYRTFLYNCQRLTFTSNTKTFSEYKTMNDIKRELAQKLKADIGTRGAKLDEYLKYVAKSQSDLPARKMKYSFDSAVVPLSSDLELRDRYITFLGNIRMGRLMEDIDLFAGHIAYKHTFNPDIPPDSGLLDMIVTVTANSLKILQDFKPDIDIRVSGHVCWVGTTSLEVMIWLDQQNNGKWERVMTALLLMASRNRATMGPAFVNKIVAETPEEELLIKGGEERKRKRMKRIEESLLKTVPSEEELHLIHDLFIKTLDSKDTFQNKKMLPPNSKWMRDASLNNLVFCHPQYKNLHNKIFGGFLIRQALELSWSVGFLYGARIPKLIYISDIGFYNPVEVGSMLKLFASITYAEEEFIQVFVHAEAFSRVNSKGKSTTSFHFTYSLDTPLGNIYPYTYLEAMKYIDGRRHFQEFKKMSSRYQS